MALNPMYRIFWYFARSCVLSCLSKFDNKKRDNSDETTSHEEETGKVKGCTCGSNLKSRRETSCKTQEGQSSRCPCVRKGIPCMEHCKCRKCSNTTSREKKPTLKSCRCGEERKTKDPGFVSCIDIEGKKNTRCPCFSTRQGCSERQLQLQQQLWFLYQN